MSRWFDSLLVRLLAAQLTVLVLAFIAMTLTVGQQRGAAVARIVAPLWAQRIDASTQTTHGVNSTPFELIRASTPPTEARSVRALRYRVLREELIARGVVIGDIRAQRTNAGEITWLELPTRPSGERWHGFVGGLIALDEAPQQPLLLSIVAALIVAISAILTWTIVRPLGRLRRAISSFQSGEPMSNRLPRDIGGPREVRALSASFVEMAKAKAELDRDRSLMLAAISHDLRSPLARIRLHADLMPDSSRESRETKLAIKNDVDIADRHLAMFLDFSAPIAIDEVQAIDIGALWGRAIELSVPSRDDVRVEVSPDAANVRSHERILLRILSMGLENAYKHGKAPIYARSLMSNDCVLLEIEDCGNALSASERERVMRPFERGESARTTPGTGLGLAIAAQMAERIGGAVELDKGERGFLFRLKLRS